MKRTGSARLERRDQGGAAARKVSTESGVLSDVH